MRLRPIWDTQTKRPSSPESGPDQIHSVHDLFRDVANVLCTRPKVDGNVKRARLGAREPAPSLLEGIMGPDCDFRPQHRRVENNVLPVPTAGRKRVQSQLREYQKCIRNTYQTSMSVGTMTGLSSAASRTPMTNIEESSSLGMR